MAKRTGNLLSERGETLGMKASLAVWTIQPDRGHATHRPVGPPLAAKSRRSAFTRISHTPSPTLANRRRFTLPLTRSARLATSAFWTPPQWEATKKKVSPANPSLILRSRA
jgi:hypothetical protein